MNLKLLSTYEPVDTNGQLIRENVNENGEEKLFLKGILQRADTLNQNGRIYPKEILEREVRNYQKFIAENRALGECVPPGTGILTKTGWKNIEQISDDEIVATLNTDTNEIEYHQIDRKVELDYSGDMYHIHNFTTIDMTLTANHNILLWNRKNEPYKLKTSEFYENLLTKNSQQSHSYFKQIDETKFFIDDTINVEKNQYDGKVFCVTTKNGNWLMKQGDCVVWTGNCDHPDSSVVNLKNVSHIIREAYMEGDVVYGTLEVLTKLPSGQILKGLIEHGVKLGISSRGVGTTRKQGDYQVVQDDFQLICWDMVSEPSTPAAFMLPEGRQLSESEIHRVLNKSDRIDRILNDILK